MSSSRFSPRTATVERTTAETNVSIALTLDGDGTYDVDTGVGFFDHMLSLFAKHGALDLTVQCDGDLEVDDHHTVEDVAIGLGRALNDALGDKAHIARYGHAYVPMDDALARAVVDLSGRSYCHLEAAFQRDQVGGLSTELVEHVWRSVADHARCNLHLTVLHGHNAHHKIEALFKAAARALRGAVHRRAAHAEVASTKGTLA
ncbi:imidazoleglycerol-phosphate dehydratase HisB [Salinibacter altiplanensis]|uniref:imidazoleglycerol-phosphate dehydratase HisB n=1 Tax=Salinibacter altiplanensis TaxID=1803181 RepID=UPI000C9F5C4E|nr:imidazoleglycerol-phosphate dehydratase HisB [Salinibacter altiplanensis]